MTHANISSSKKSTDIYVTSTSNMNKAPTTASLVQSLQSPARVCLPYRCYTQNEILKCFRVIVDRAIRANKTFTVVGNWSVVRKALIQRGWIEKIQLTQRWNSDSTNRFLMTKNINELVLLLKKGSFLEPGKLVIMSKLLAGHQVDFHWNMSGVHYSFNATNDANNDSKLTMVNHIRRNYGSYSTKSGLAESNERAHWLNNPGSYKFDHPRSYHLITDENTESFIQDFKTTAARSLLLWVVKRSKYRKPNVMSDRGTISLSIFQFALKECYKFIKRNKHLDIDQAIGEDTDKRWNIFLENFYRVAHGGEHFVAGENETQRSMIQKANDCIKQLKGTCNYIEADGFSNIWILKPCYGSQGFGIHICRTLQYMLKVLSQNKNLNYVVQKYIGKLHGYTFVCMETAVLFLAGLLLLVFSS